MSQFLRLGALSIATFSLLATGCTVGAIDGSGPVDEEEPENEPEIDIVPDEQGTDIPNPPVDGPVETLSITFTTQPTLRGEFAPNNVVAVWITQDEGLLAQTFMQYGLVYKGSLTAWTAANPAVSLDAVTGATRSLHGPLTASWQVPADTLDGNYTVHLEVADTNLGIENVPNITTVPFVRDGVAATLSLPDTANFTNMSMEYSGAIPPAE